MLIKAWQSGLTAAALFMLAVTVVALVAFAVAPVVREGWRKWRKRASAGVAVAASAFAIIYGGSKGVNAGADEGIVLAEVTANYDPTNDVTAVAVKWTEGTVSTSTPVSVRNAESEQWRELVKIGAAIETGATNVLSFTVAGDESAHGFWWVGFDTPAVIVETAGITITNFVATSKSVSIAWTCDATNQQYFTVQRKHPADAEWQVAGDVWTNTTFALSGFTVGETWMWRIIGERLPTARDYVQDGLVILWDGIENAGWGVHDPNATAWADLTGNGYDMTLTANAIVMADGMKMKSANVVGSGVGEVNYSGDQNALMFDVCLTWSSNGRDSRCIIANGPVTTSGSMATICAKQDQYFEWSSQWRNNIVVFSDGRTLTLTAGYGKGYVNAERFTGNATDTWGFTAGKIAVLGDPRSAKYASSGATAHSVRVYNRELTAAEVKHNAETDRRRFRLP